MSTQNIRIGPCEVIFDGQQLGLTIGGVEVEVTTSTHTTMVDQLGETIVDEFVMGRNITIKVPLAETTIENLVKLMPGSVLVTDGVAASGTITVAVNPANNETMIVNGVTYTFKTVAVSETDIELGATASLTALEIATVLGRSIDPLVSVATYTRVGAVVTVTYDTTGVAGNAFTLDAGTAGADLTLSGATLASGVDATKSRLDVSLNAGFSLLSSAKKLILHPTAKPANDRSEDLIVWKANAPGELQFAYKFDQERVFMANFKGFPDPASSYRLFSIGHEEAV